MKIKVQVLEKNDMDSFIVNNSKTIEFKTGTKSKKIQDAKDKVNDLKILKTPNQKIRIIEYHNDESDENRTPCIILEEI
jgi:hypothetical protein